MSFPSIWPVEPATDEAARIQQQFMQPPSSAAVDRQVTAVRVHTVGFHVDEGRYNLFVNVADMMYKEGILKNNSVSELLRHAAAEACNTYLFDLMRRVKSRESLQSGGPRRDSANPYYHIDPLPSDNGQDW